MTIATYTDLVTSEHRDAPKYMAMIEANVKLLVRIQDVIYSMIEKFDVDSAEGAQLDVVGLWVGVSRYINTPLTGIYFTWDDTAFDGWDMGIWQGEFDPDSGITSLPDDEYRILIKAKIAANRWNGSIPDAYEIWETIFTENIIVIQDNQDMSMDIIIVGEPLNSLTLALLTGGYIPLKPEGVRVNTYAYAELPLFVWDGEEDSINVAGWDEGNWADIFEPT